MKRFRPEGKRPAPPSNRMNWKDRRAAAAAAPPRPPRAERRPAPVETPELIFTHEVPTLELARATAEIAARAERAAFVEGKRPEPIIASSIKALRGFSLVDRLFISRSVDSLFRWWGWLEPLRLQPIEARLLVAVLLDRMTVHDVCRVWAKQIGVDTRVLSPIGTAPNWGRRADAFRRLVEQPKATTEPWTLFPRWVHDEILIPPGEQPIKHRLADLLQTLQRPIPPWIRAVKGRPEALWTELRQAGSTPRIHPVLTNLATVDPETILQSLEPVRRGDLKPADPGSLAIVAVCDAEPGERWWYAGKARGDRSMLLADRMKGKGTLIVGDLDERDRARTAKVARKGPHSNVNIRSWDGKHVAGKAGTYHGVLLEPPSSGLGLWRRDPASRWFVDQKGLDRLVEEQARLLRVAAMGVRPTGVLVYAVPSLAKSETTTQIERFLKDHQEFRLDPFPEPLAEGPPTDGTATLWPDQTDSDAWFLARMIRVPSSPRIVSEESEGSLEIPGETQHS